MKDYDKELEKAKERLKKAKPSINANNKQKYPMKEPKSLVSGRFDEVELMRQQKGLDDE